MREANGKPNREACGQTDLARGSATRVFDARMGIVWLHRSVAGRVHVACRHGARAALDSLHAMPTTDEDLLSSNPLRLFGSEKDDGIRNIFGSAHAPKRDTRKESLF